MTTDIRTLTKTDIRTVTKLEYWVLMGILTFSMLIIWLPNMGAFYILGDIGGGTVTASWGVTFCLLGNVITKPIGRVLSGKIGNYRLLKISLVLTLLTIFPMILTWDYNLYLVSRYLAGIFSGPIFSIVTNICRVHRTDNEIHFLMILVMCILLAAPICATTFGAVLAYEGLWRGAYMIIYFIGLVLLALVLILTKGHESPLSKDPVDWVGIITFWIGFTGWGFCLITGQLIDGFRSLAFNIVLALSTSVMLFFLIWNSMHKAPILPLGHFKKEKFAVAILHLTVVYLIYNAASLLLSYWLALYANYTVKWVGYLLSLNLIGPMAAIFVFKYRMTKLNIWFTVLSLGMMCCLTFGAGHLSVQVDLFRIAIIKIVLGLAFAINLPVVLYNIRTSFTTKDFGAGWAFFVIFKLIGTLVGIAYFSILWERRAAFYHWRLGGELTPFSVNLQRVFDVLNSFRFTPLMKDAGLNVALDRQVRSLALNDCFFLMTCILFGVFVLTIIYACFQRKFKDETLPDAIRD